MFSGIKKLPCNAIGIDFGTSKTVLSVFRNGVTEVILDPEENRYTPSCICYTDEERLIGNLGMSIYGKFPTNSISGLKKFLGQKYADLLKIQPRPIKIESDENGKNPLIIVESRGTKKFPPEQIAAAFFSKLKESAEKRLGIPIKYAVISIPCTFSRIQIEALKNAANIAGLNILSTVTEGALEGIEYAEKQTDTSSRIVCFFNMGGGYLDISLCNIVSGACFVISTEGAEIGGINLDLNLAKYCNEIYQKKTGKNIFEDPKLTRKLLINCEKAKKILSTLNDTNIEIAVINGDEEICAKITKTQFEELNKNIFEKCYDTMSNLLKKTGFSKEDIQEIVLLGGCTRVPKIKLVVKTFFGKDPQFNINSDEAIANSAAIHAALLSGFIKPMGKDKSHFNDALNSAIGIMKNGESDFIEIMAPFTQIPAKNSKKINVEEGYIRIAEKIYDKIFVLDEIEIPIKNSEIEICLEIDLMNLITITLKYKDANGKEISYGNIVNCKDKLSNEEIEKIIAQEKKLHFEDIQFIKAKEEKNELEKYCINIKNEIAVQKHIDEKLKDFMRKCIEIILEQIGIQNTMPIIEYTNRKMLIGKIYEAIKKKKFDSILKIENLPEEIKSLALNHNK